MLVKISHDRFVGGLSLVKAVNAKFAKRAACQNGGKKRNLLAEAQR